MDLKQHIVAGLNYFICPFAVLTLWVHVHFLHLFDKGRSPFAFAAEAGHQFISGKLDIGGVHSLKETNNNNSSQFTAMRAPLPFFDRYHPHKSSPILIRFLQWMFSDNRI